MGAKVPCPPSHMRYWPLQTLVANGHDIEIIVLVSILTKTSDFGMSIMWFKCATLYIVDLSLEFSEIEAIFFIH